MNLDIHTLRSVFAARERLAREETIARPTRDWALLLSMTLLGLIAVGAGAWFVHERVASGTLVSLPQGERSSLEGLSAEELETLMQALDARASSHARALGTGSRIIDPSR